MCPKCPRDSLIKDQAQENLCRLSASVLDWNLWVERVSLG